MSLLRPFRTIVDPIAGNAPWSTTQLPTGVTGPFDIRSPSGSMIIKIQPASFEEIGGGGLEQNLRPQLFLPDTPRSLARLEHVGPLPTLISIATGGGNISGTLRVWVGASADLKNGAWCEIERTVNDDVPAMFSLGFTQTAVGYDTLDEDDGRSGDFGLSPVGLDPYVTLYGAVFSRILLLRYGYTEDGAETVVGFFRTMTTIPSSATLEVAAQPLYAIPSEESTCPVSVALRVTQNALDQAIDSDSVMSFDCPSALLRPSGDFSEQFNALQWTHVAQSARDERLGSSEIIQTTPLPVNACSLTTVIDDNFTQTVPRVPGVAESQKLSHSRGYFGTPQYNRPDLVQRLSFAVKNGPWWHETAIVSPGTSAAITGARHRLTVTMPKWNQVLAVPLVSYGFNQTDRPRLLQVQNDAALARRALQGQQFLCDPTIGGEPLLQGCYAAERMLDVIDTQSPGPLDPVITNTDFTIMPYAKVFVRTNAERTIETKNFRAQNPWPTRDAAIDAGMSEDAYDYYAKSSDNYFNIFPNGVRMHVQVVLDYQWTVTRIAPQFFPASNGYFRSHFTARHSFLFFVTDDQCVDLANGETAEVAEYSGGLPSTGGLATGFSAAISLSVL